MYFVGIDISKFKHDCAIIDELGDVITSSWSFDNDCEGFSLFRDLLNALDGEKKIACTIHCITPSIKAPVLDAIGISITEAIATSSFVVQVLRHPPLVTNLYRLVFFAIAVVS